MSDTPPISVYSDVPIFPKVNTSIAQSPTFGAPHAPGAYAQWTEPMPITTSYFSVPTFMAPPTPSSPPTPTSAAPSPLTTMYDMISSGQERDWNEEYQQFVETSFGDNPMTEITRTKNLRDLYDEFARVAKEVHTTHSINHNTYHYTWNHPITATIITASSKSHVTVTVTNSPQQLLHYSCKETSVSPPTHHHPQSISPLPLSHHHHFYHHSSWTGVFQVGATIISELFLPVEQKTVKPITTQVGGLAGGEKVPSDTDDARWWWE